MTIYNKDRGKGVGEGCNLLCKDPACPGHDPVVSGKAYWKAKKNKLHKPQEV